jgi:catalase
MEIAMTVESLELGREYPPAGEELLIAEILRLSRLSMEHRPHPPTMRDQHPKSHGYLAGEFIVAENIPGDLQVGVFAKPKTYPIWVRFSNTGSDRDGAGNFLPDAVGDGRGMAIKLMNVEGEMTIEDCEHSGEQDFLLVNNSTFFIRDVEGYISFFAIMRAIGEGRLNPGDPASIPADLQPDFQAIAYAFPLVQNIKAKVTPSPLKVRYWSMTPYKFGNKAMKFSATPHTTDQQFDLNSVTDRSYLQTAMVQQLATEDAYFDFKIQLQTDPVKMPIEDPLVEWNEQDAPFIKVATIRIFQQDFNTADRKQQDEQQSFSPWHALRVHQPLGGVNRARKIYTNLAKVRNKINQDS